ncbi:unnamed protein product [Rhizopus stolonifer]
MSDESIVQNENLLEQLQIVLEQEYKRLNLFDKLHNEFTKYCKGEYSTDEYGSTISQPILDEFQQVYIKIDKAQKEMNDSVAESSVKYLQQNEKERLEKTIEIQKQKILKIKYDDTTKEKGLALTIENASNELDRLKELLAKVSSLLC